MPGWSDLSSVSLSPFFDNLWGFQYDPQTGDFSGRLAGKSVRDWLGANFWGASLKDLHPPHVVKDASEFFLRVITQPAMGRCSGTLFTAAGKPITGERIALPLGDGVTGSGILGASDYERVEMSGPVELIHEGQEYFPL